MKKTIFSKLMLGMLMIASGFAFNACSSDDEPVPQSKELDEAVERLYTKDGDPNIIGFMLDDEVVYVAPSETPESGKTLLEYYLGAEVKGDNFIQKFDDHNIIRVSSGEEGVFYNVSVNFNGYKPYSFKVAPMEWLLGDNQSVAPPFVHGGAAIICLDCGAETHWLKMTTAAPTCSKCGSKHVRIEPRGN